MHTKTSRPAYQWRVTMEHHKGIHKQTFMIPAFSGQHAQKIARIRLDTQGENAKYWHMVGLVRLP